MAFCYSYEPYGMVEELEDYEPGGFLPCVRGGVLGPDERYQICEKLGHGGNGTVWMCLDTLCKKWKAIKILSVKASDELDGNDCKELTILKHFQDLGISREELEANHICLPEEHFWVEGPHGRHLCFVLPLLGESITDCWRRYGDNPEILRRICLQLVEAMQFLHDKGICHGDFRSANILFKYPGIEDLSPEKLTALLPESEEVPLVPIDEVTEEEPELQLPPNYPPAVYTATSVKLPLDFTDIEIVVTDFGEAYHASSPPPANGIPLSHAAPEVVFGAQAQVFGLEDSFRLGFATDIWALGAALCEIRQGHVPFEYHDILPWVQRLEEMIGPLPEPYRATYIDSGYTNKWVPTPPRDIPATELLTWSASGLERFRNDHGHSNWLENLVRMSCQMTMKLEEGEDLTNKKNQHHIEGMSGYKRVVYQTPAKEADHLLHLLKKMFRYHPKDRISIDEVVLHPWVTGKFDEEGTGKEGSIAVTQAPVEQESSLPETSKADTDMANSEREVSFTSANAMHSTQTLAALEDVSGEASETDAMVLQANTSPVVEQAKHQHVMDKAWRMCGFGALYQGCKRLWEQAYRRE